MAGPLLRPWIFSYPKGNAFAFHVDSGIRPSLMPISTVLRVEGISAWARVCLEIIYTIESAVVAYFLRLFPSPFHPLTYTRLVAYRSQAINDQHSSFLPTFTSYVKEHRTFDPPKQREKS